MPNEIIFMEKDIQKLCKRHFGDELTRKELEFISLMIPEDWSKIDNDRFKGCLKQIVEGVLSIIDLARVERRSGQVR